MKIDCLLSESNNRRCPLIDELREPSQRAPACKIPHSPTGNALVQYPSCGPLHRRCGHCRCGRPLAAGDRL